MIFPVLVKDMSPQKKLDLCEEIIDEFSKIEKVGDYTFVVLPVFKLNGNFKLKIDIYPGRFVLVDYDIFDKYDLGMNPVYIAEDSKDKRPALLMSSGNLFEGGTTKKFLVDLIVGPLQNPDIELYYKDGDFCNLKSNNIDFREKTKEIDPIPPFVGSAKEPIVNKEENNTSEEILPPNNEENKEANNEKVLKILDNIDKARGLTPLEQQLATKGTINSDDASKLRHSWLGVTSYETKHGTRYTATLKGVTIQSGFGHPLDAARKYNEFILKHELPYPVNNIPGFLALEINRQIIRRTLDDYETWELAEEIVRRTKTEEHKF